MIAAVDTALGGETRFDERAGAPGRERTSARLGRYAWWQLRDFVRERGVWIVSLGLVALWIFRADYDYSWIARANRAFGWLPTESQYFRSQFASLVEKGAFVATLIASHGIVARDRERGYQRFLFAKPVNVVRYYLQAFLVNGAGLLAATVLLLLATMLVFLRPDVPVLAVLGYVSVEYVMLGGIVMLISTFARYDFAVGALLTGLALPVGYFAHRAHPRLWAVLLAPLLPPVGALDRIGEAMASTRPSSGLEAEVARALAYGVGCLAVALWMLRRRAIRV